MRGIGRSNLVLYDLTRPKEDKVATVSSISSALNCKGCSDVRQQCSEESDNF